MHIYVFLHYDSFKCDAVTSVYDIILKSMNASVLKQYHNIA